MLEKIIRFSVYKKTFILILVGILVVVGFIELRKLPIDAVPDITNNQVQVITQAPAYSAPDVERWVTFPIEQSLANIPGIVELRSFSRFGLSLITVVFTDNTNIYWARQQIAERLTTVAASIPKEVGQPELGPVSTGLGEIYQYTIRPKKGFEHVFTPTELRTIQDWVVRKQLLGVQGVAEVSSFGGNLKQYEIAVDPTRLAGFGVSIADIADAVEKNNGNTGGAYLEKTETVQYIRTDGLVKTIEDIQNIPVPTKDGASIPLRELATIKEGKATRYGALYQTEVGEVAGGIVMMLKGENSNEVITRVKQKFEEIKKTLPVGVQIDPFLDRSKMVNGAIRTVSKNLMEGALIVIFILVLFLGNLRAGLIVSSVIPLSLLFAVILMNLFGVSGNLMSLGALDFGLIVDGAVIVVEAALHELHKNKIFAGIIHKSDSVKQTVIHSSNKIISSTVYGQLFILLVYIPILTLQGIEGKMFLPMAQTVLFALLGAFLLSITYVPMMSAWVLQKEKKSQKASISDKMMKVITHYYRRFLAFSMRRYKWVLATTTLVFLLSLYWVTHLGAEFVPELEEGDFAVDTRVISGSNLKTTLDYTAKASELLKAKFPEVEKVVVKIGSGEVPTDPMPMEASDMMVILKDKSTWTTTDNFRDLADTMQAALKAIPGITSNFQFPVQMRFNELMTGAKQDVVCKIFGDNLDSLIQAGNRLAKIVERTKGTKDVYLEPIEGVKQLVIRFDRNKLAAFGVNIDQANSTVNAALAGKKVGVFYQEGRKFDIVVRWDRSQQITEESIRNLPIPRISGDFVALYAIADVESIATPNQIQRENAQRRISVSFNVAGKDVEQIVQDIQKESEKSLHLPDGYYLTFGGSFQNLVHAKQRLSIVVPIVLMAIFLLLYALFRSVKDSLLIYSAIPLSSIGGILLLHARDMPLSISAGVGFIVLFGISVLNGIVLISEFNRLMKNGMKSYPEIIFAGCRTRLRPVLMTALVASLGFLPMALSTGMGSEVQRPLATVVIGGLLLSTLLTLIVLPILFLITRKKKK